MHQFSSEFLNEFLSKLLPFDIIFKLVRNIQRSQQLPTGIGKPPKNELLAPPGILMKVPVKPNSETGPRPLLYYNHVKHYNHVKPRPSTTNNYPLTIVFPRFHLACYEKRLYLRSSKFTNSAISTPWLGRVKNEILTITSLAVNRPSQTPPTAVPPLRDPSSRPRR